MVLLPRSTELDETMPQTVPSAGFTPPCDYSSFAEHFDLSLLPPDCGGGDYFHQQQQHHQPLSPSTQFYTQSPPPPRATDKNQNPEIFTTFYPNSPQSTSEPTAGDNNTNNNNKNNNNNDDEISCSFRPDLQSLLESEDEEKPHSDNNSRLNLFTENIYLVVPQQKLVVRQQQPSSPASSTESAFSPNHSGLLSPGGDNFGNNYRQSNEANFYPSSPELSLYNNSPGSVYSRSPCEDFLNSQYGGKTESTYNNNNNSPSYSPYYVKEELFASSCGFSSPTSPATSYSSLSSPEQINTGTTASTHPTQTKDVLDLLEHTVLDKQIKQESTVDFSNILNNFQDTESLRQLLEDDFQDTKPSVVEPPPRSSPKDHQLLREVLRDTSFQKKYNIKPIDFGFISGADIKMEEPDEGATTSSALMRENIEPVFNLAIEQMRKDVSSTCAALGISPDPKQWTSANVLSWLQWTSRQFGLSEPAPEQWDVTGANLVTLSEEDFTRRSPQGGMILHAQLEIWKAAYSEEEMSMPWLPETTSSTASSGDMSDDDDEEAVPGPSQTPTPDPAKPTTSRSGGQHIHLWQFLKELLSNPQTHGSCIRWLDRSKGIFKIEDSVKVARLWGKRKNRPAMNYDKLSRSIRQYYKKGIMKKTERSQRLVYQFCHPYNL